VFRVSPEVALVAESHEILQRVIPLAEVDVMNVGEPWLLSTILTAVNIPL